MTRGKAIIAFSLLLLCLTASSTVYLHLVKAQHQGTITINTDGSVSPSSAPITQSGNEYTLTSNIDGSIEIDKSSIIFNGNSHIINGEASISGEAFGITLERVTNVTVTNTTVTNTGNGILALDEPTAGINVYYGGSNVIKGNNISNNYNAMSFVESVGNFVLANNITNNHNPYVIVSALMFWGSSNNTIYHNNFINNTSPAGDASYNSPSSVNVWDTGYPIGGNYWSNYQSLFPNAKEVDSSGIGDTAYVIDKQNNDNYPLMNPFNTTFETQQSTSPQISLISPMNQTYNDSSVALTFSVEVLSPIKSVSWTGYSLDSEPNVTMISNNPITNVTISNITIGIHNITVYANDSYGNVGSQTVNFTVEKQQTEIFVNTIIIAVITVPVAIICLVAILLVFRRHRKTSNSNQRPFPTVGFIDPI